MTYESWCSKPDKLHRGHRDIQVIRLTLCCVFYSPLMFNKTELFICLADICHMEILNSCDSFYILTTMIHAEMQHHSCDIIFLRAIELFSFTQVGSFTAVHIVKGLKNGQALHLYPVSSFLLDLELWSSQRRLHKVLT